MEEPGSKYIDHVSPISGKARDVVTEIQAIISETESNETPVAIGCDGCVTNNGKYSGINRRLEVSIDRPLQWMICMLHLNELIAPCSKLSPNLRKYNGNFT